MFAINVSAPYHSAVEMVHKIPNGGRISSGSCNGDWTAFSGLATYATTKSVLQGMARGLSRDFVPRSITVNVVEPGPTDTDMNPPTGRVDRPNEVIEKGQFARRESWMALSWLKRSQKQL